MDPGTDSLKNKLQRRLDGAFPSAQCPYDRVAVLVLYWLEDDFTQPCAKEAEKVVDIFKNNFKYETQIFPIPSINAQSALEQTVSAFKYRNEPTNHLESTLLIVYYSGHGDPDLKSGKAVWAAKRTGEPTLDWFLIQPMLMRTQADVLLILDCCYASLAGKGRDSGSRVDLLAAAPDGGTTPSPGPYSFTQHFISVTKQGLEDGSELQISNIARLVHKRSSQTPVYLPLRTGGENSNSIVLRPLQSQINTESAGSAHSTTSGGAFSFTIIVSDPPSERHVKQLGEWIKTSAPRSISSVRVDSIINLSNSLREFVLDEGKAGYAGRYIDTIPPDEKKRIVSEFCDIGKVIALAKTDILGTTTTSDPEILEPKAHNSFRSIEEQTMKLSRLLWHTLTNHPGYQTWGQLVKLKENPVAQQAGVSQAARMSLLARDLCLELEPEAREIPLPELHLKRIVRDDDKFISGTFEKREVMVEISRMPLGSKLLTPLLLKMKLKKICSLLATPKPEYFKIFRCLGFCCDQRQGWHGLVFQMPEGFHNPTRLRHLFQKTPRMPLEKRYAMAYTIATSLAALHSVHWVHKGIRSENMLLFLDKDSMLPVHSCGPWLFGFDDSRENVALSSNQADYRIGRRIYFPPSRWGTPTEKFSYRHDIYALGVLLLEIGLWTYVLQLDKSGFKEVATAEEARDILLKRANQDISHAMGSEFSGVVLGCLRGKSEKGQDQELDFQCDVLDVLEELCKHKPEKSNQ